MKNCRTIKKQLTAYLHGELNEQDFQTLENHMEACPACRAELDALRSTLELLGETLAVAPAPSECSLPVFDEKPVWVKSARRQSYRIPVFGTQLKSLAVSGAIFGGLIVFAGGLVVFKAIERKGIQFAPTIAYDSRTSQSQQPRVLEEPNPEFVRNKDLPDVAVSEMPGDIAGEDSLADALNGDAEFDGLAEMPAASVVADESMRVGLMNYRRGVRLGGSWDDLDADSIKSASGAGRPASQALPLFAVVFRLTVGSDGTLMAFDVEKVVDPRADAMEALEMDIPTEFIASAQNAVLEYEVDLSHETAEPSVFYEYFFYDPRFPDQVILPPAPGGE